MILAYTSLMIEEASPDLFNLGCWVTGLTVFITPTSRSWLPLPSHQCRSGFEVELADRALMINA